jgi:hypothetical protein
LGANLHRAVCTPDASGPNQYADRQAPGYAQGLGTASAGANVVLWTTNSGYGLSSRKETYFRAELPVNNTNGPLWLALTNAALTPGGSSGTDVVSSAAGNLFAPQSPEWHTNDADRNLKIDGHWAYTWDSENRLVQIHPRSVNNRRGGKKAISYQFAYSKAATQEVFQEVWVRQVVTVPESGNRNIQANIKNIIRLVAFYMAVTKNNIESS